jgi:three-Cys-motif partner protein
MAGPKATLWRLEPHSRGKHHILRRYVQAWLPIMTSGHGRVVLVDGFAGPGRYLGGEEGSPLILLKAYLEHRYRDRMSSEIVYLFIDERADRVEYLREEVEKLELPANVQVDILHGTYQDIFRRRLDELQQAGQRLAPTFAFVDPFGYSDAPMELTGLFLQFQRCEVLIYIPLPFVARFLDRDGQETALNALFGTSRWRQGIRLGWEERLAFLHDLFRDQLRNSGCTYVRSFEIRSGAARGYHLFFGTTNLKGLEKMKEAMWSLDPLTGQQFGDSTNGEQLVLFQTDPDTTPLLNALQEQFGDHEFSIEAAERFTLTDTPFAIGHLRNRTLAPSETRGELEATTARRRVRTYPPGTRLRFRA